MTTTAVRAPAAAPRRDEVMKLSFEVSHRLTDGPPPVKDAARVGAIRRIVVARLRCWSLDEAMTADVVLIVSELLTNAVLHSGSKEIGLSLVVRDGFLCGTVDDGMPGKATRTHVSGDAESGRGLVIVEALVKAYGGAWGTEGDGAETWCRLALPEGAS